MHNSPQTLTPQLTEIALEALKAYLHAPALDGRTPIDMEVEGDRKRIEVIENKLKPLLASYLASSISAADFKSRIDHVNRLNPLWGFKGVKGQMFFNLLMKNAEDASECDAQLKSVVRAPANEEDAITLLKNFRIYVERVRQHFISGGGALISRPPNPSSVPFFVSYFWQIQQRDVWPIYYTNTVQMIEGMNLWHATGEIGDDYLTYKRLHEILVDIYSKAAGRPFSLYDVEHVFWFKSGRLLAGASPTQPAAKSETAVVAAEASTAPIASQSALMQPNQASVLPDSYVPPIIAVIPRLALNDPELQEVARRSGIKLERALEKSVNAAFTVLGYEAELLGQGKGRVPDGQAIAVEESYALLWDAKARAEAYTMGTDDRVIQQYIQTQSQSLKRRSAIRNIYYLIISSRFSDDFDHSIRTLKMGTNVSDVCLVEASALVAIVDQRLRAPLKVTLGPGSIQRLFSSSGLITANDVLEYLD